MTSARNVYNAHDRRHPALIAQVRGRGRRHRAVNLAREKKMLLAIRGGGHNGAGLGVATTPW